MEAAKYRPRVPSASRELAIARLGRFDLPQLAKYFRTVRRSTIGGRIGRCPTPAKIIPPCESISEMITKFGRMPGSVTGFSYKRVGLAQRYARRCELEDADPEPVQIQHLFRSY
jgi:hypothetical protein